MSQPDLAQALARLDEHHKLHLPLRRGDLLGRLALRFLWKRNLKWQMETNIATRDAVQTIQHIVQDVEGTLQYLRSKLEPIADSIGDGTGVTMNAGIGPELEALRRSDQNILAGLNQRFYAAVGRIQTELGELRLELTEREEGTPGFADRLKALEARIADLVSAERDIQLRHARVDLFLDEVRQTQPDRPDQERLAALPDRNSFLEVAVCALLDGQPEQVREARAGYLPVLREARAAGATGPVLDMAPGRGEWAGLLAADGVPYRSASRNSFVRKHFPGDELADEDPMDLLAGAGRWSLGAVTAFRYVEQLDPAGLARFADLTSVALQPGGVLVVETPNANPDFYLDPFARRPVHQDYLRFLVDAAGFSHVRIPAELPASTTKDRYCLLAWR